MSFKEACEGKNRGRLTQEEAARLPGEAIIATQAEIRQYFMDTEN
jgi:hypothetical protein